MILFKADKASWLGSKFRNWHDLNFLFVDRVENEKKIGNLSILCPDLYLNKLHSKANSKL